LRFSTLYHPPGDLALRPRYFIWQNRSATSVCHLDIHIVLLYYINNMLHTVSARQIQREYKKVLENANKSKEPIIVMANNKPLGAIIGLEMLEKIQLQLIVKQALKESKSGKIRIIETTQDLEQDFKDIERYATSRTVD